jgi:hypothetical protein
VQNFFLLSHRRLVQDLLLELEPQPGATTFWKSSFLPYAFYS